MRREVKELPDGLKNYKPTGTRRDSVTMCLICLWQYLEKDEKISPLTANMIRRDVFDAVVEISENEKLRGVLKNHHILDHIRERRDQGYLEMNDEDMDFLREVLK